MSQKTNRTSTTVRTSKSAPTSTSVALRPPAGSDGGGHPGLAARILRLDVRILWIILTIVIMIPLAKPIGLPIRVGEPARKAFDYVGSLPPGSVVALSVDVAPSSEAENWPQAVAMARHMMALGHRIMVVTWLPEGVMYGNRLAHEIAPAYGYTYGEDIVVLPYRAGDETAVSAFGDDLRGFYDADYYGTPLEDLPMMQSIGGIEDIALVASFSSGDSGLWFIRQVEGKHGTPLVHGTVGPGVSQYLVYVSSGQLRGLLGGMAGAAEYEFLAKAPGKALAAMDAQSVAHVYFIALMVISNVAFFLVKRTRARQADAG